MICFVGSYLVAWLLEWVRTIYKSPICGTLAFAASVAGLVAHTAYLYYTENILHHAIASDKTFFTVAAWGVVLVSLYLQLVRPQNLFGLFLLPVAMLLILLGHWPGTTIAVQSGGIAKVTFWKVLHTVSILATTLVMSLGFVVSVMYLVQDRRLRLRLPNRLVTLPSLEWSGTVCRHIFLGAVFLIGVCFITGVLLRPSAVNDPLIFGTIIFFGFLLFYARSVASNKASYDGRRIAVLTLLSALILLAVLLSGIVIGGHWKKSQHGARGVSQAMCANDRMTLAYATGSVFQTEESP